MVAAQTTLKSLVEDSRCDDRSRLTVEEQNLHPKAGRADTSIAEKVDTAFWNNGMLRGTDYREIDVEVKDGIVFLSGHVITTTNQQQAEDAVRTIPGVLGVTSYLVPDDKLTWEVAGALGKIEHDYGVKFFTGARNGVVGLNGAVGSASLRSLAEKYAANVPGVRGVINFVQAPGIDMQLEDQRFLQPAIGEQIFYRDSLCGTVQKVIVNPNNRRVVAMVVREQFSNSPQNSRSLMYREAPAPERLILISVSAIRYITKSSGFLDIKSDETAGTSDFDPACFRAPKKGWTPPYPYCPDQVLFPAESVEEMAQTENEPAFISAQSPRTQPAMPVEMPV